MRSTSSLGEVITCPTETIPLLLYIQHHYKCNELIQYRQRNASVFMPSTKRKQDFRNIISAGKQLSEYEAGEFKKKSASSLKSPDRLWKSTRLLLTGLSGHAFTGYCIYTPCRYKILRCYDHVSTIKTLKLENKTIKETSKDRKNKKYGYFSKKVVQKFGSFEKTPYLCTRKKEKRFFGTQF